MNYELTLINKEIISTADLVANGFTTDTAKKVMREIKANSDVLGIRGKCHRADYIKYLLKDRKCTAYFVEK